MQNTLDSINHVYGTLKNLNYIDKEEEIDGVQIMSDFYYLNNLFSQTYELLKRHKGNSQTKKINILYNKLKDPQGNKIFENMKQVRNFLKQSENAIMYFMDNINNYARPSTQLGGMSVEQIKVLKDVAIKILKKHVGKVSVDLEKLIIDYWKKKGSVGPPQKKQALANIYNLLDQAKMWAIKPSDLINKLDKLKEEFNIQNSAQIVKTGSDLELAQKSQKLINRIFFLRGWEKKGFGRTMFLDTTQTLFSVLQMFLSIINSVVGPAINGACSGVVAGMVGMAPGLGSIAPTICPMIAKPTFDIFMNSFPFKVNNLLLSMNRRKWSEAYISFASLIPELATWANFIEMKVLKLDRKFTKFYNRVSDMSDKVTDVTGEINNFYEDPTPAQLREILKQVLPEDIRNTLNKGEEILSKTSDVVSKTTKIVSDVEDMVPKMKGGYDEEDNLSEVSMINT